MQYGTGAPLWGKKGEELSSPQQQQGQASSLNSRYQSPSRAYQPPSLGGTEYAQQQTNIMEDAMRQQYEAEGTAQAVMSQMTTQRYQISGAHGNVSEMREATEKTKREIKDLATKRLRKKRRLQMIAGALALTDLFLFFRLLVCGGSFFCRRY
mmetsp:Transcript_15397/g.22678  ORF Transcript_15397/g.22678 Transcript_15397/m.22678 type:complete len:153 (-) Transcript_15397:301-759(-)|eukprot:CAMPEP_0195517932 /NCGR_PEP_ID=MMETSP0794_2-20130614/11830_1 /TAXON_ID=515487 /ORGANISM="Stephanopyxis turris, Strain CCMP 815" /LENGTH=152 /DNA_ID=CAMNT_0040646813 /DNA_START=320 /DNA_END=781 /DNA_ORIENTATION=-